MTISLFDLCFCFILDSARANPMQNLPSLLLVSQSPRRKQILESVGLLFQSKDPRDVTEKHPEHTEVDEITCWNATTKAGTLLNHVSDETILIGCDTLVVLKNEVLGKPKDKADALATLAKLSGQKHTVVSGLTLLSKKFGKVEVNAKTDVYFRTLSQKEMYEYAETKEPYDKAGSYAVQGMGTVFIERIDGSYTNVMGFPLETFLRELPGFTKIPLYQWFLA